MPEFIPDTELQLQPRDVFLTNDTSFVSKAIRFFTRRIGESRTQANHVEIIVQEGTVHSALAVEALALVRRHALGRYASKEKTKVAVFHPINRTADEKERIVARANSHVGRKYGVLRIVTPALDWALQGAYVFRRPTNEDNYPICSWVVAHAFKAADKDFGIEAGAASPDDIWDFVTNKENQDKYQQVRRLISFPRSEGRRAGDRRKNCLPLAEAHSA